jgi:hypothetical protein
LNWAIVALAVGVFVLLVFPVFVIGKRRGLKNSWAAFIPLLGAWIVLFESIGRSGWLALMVFVARPRDQVPPRALPASPVLVARRKADRLHRERSSGPGLLGSARWQRLARDREGATLVRGLGARDWRRVVYWGGRQRADLYTARFPYSRPKRLTHTGTSLDILSATWNPTERRVAFVASKRGDFRSALFVVNADGTGLRRLLAEVAWPPCGVSRAAACSSKTSRRRLVTGAGAVPEPKSGERRCKPRRAGLAPSRGRESRSPVDRFPRPGSAPQTPHATPRLVA